MTRLRAEGELLTPATRPITWRATGRRPHLRPALEPGEWTMPKLVEDPKEVLTWIQERQQLEVMLGWEILDIFNSTQDFIQPLRYMAGLALNEMVGLCGATEAAFKAVVAGLTE